MHFGKIKVDGLITFDHNLEFDKNGNIIFEEFDLNVGDLTTDDFSFNYMLLNALGFKLNNKKQYIHSLMMVFHKTMMASTQALIQSAMGTQKEEDDSLYG